MVCGALFGGIMASEGGEELALSGNMKESLISGTDSSSSTTSEATVLTQKGDSEHTHTHAPQNSSAHGVLEHQGNHYRDASWGLLFLLHVFIIFMVRGAVRCVGVRG